MNLKKPRSCSVQSKSLPAAVPRWSTVVVFAGVLAVVGCRKKQPPASRDEALRLRTTLATEAIRQGDYELAAREYQSLLDMVRRPLTEQGRHALTTARDLEPVDRAVDRHRRLAHRFEQEGQPRLAVSEWKSVIGLLDLAITRERQNALVQRDGEGARAARKKRLLARRRDQADAYQRLGEACKLAGDESAAVRNLSLAYRKRAALFQEEGEPDRAIEELTRCVTIVPEDVSARWALAEALEAQGRFADAAAQYRALARRSPTDMNARQKLAETLLKGDRFTEAATEYTKLIDQQRRELANLPPGLPTSASRAQVIRARLKTYYTDLATAFRRAGQSKGAQRAEHLARELASAPK